MLLALGFTAKIASAQLYEADTSSGRILEFTPAGVESTVASELSAPVGVAFDAAGNLFVSASGSGKILKFTGAVKSTFASGLEQPAGLAFDASGNLFVAASGTGRILKFTPAGVKTTFAGALSNPSGLAFDSFGNLFVGTSTGVAGGGEILKFTPSGVKSIFATGLFRPSGLAFGANGNLYVADNGAAHIYEFTPAGVQSTFASVSTFGLAFDAFGDLFSSDDGNRIQKLGPGGAVSTFATGLSHSGLLAFAPFAVLHSFDNTDGEAPQAALIVAINGDLYGTAGYGGTNCAPVGCGTIFKITPSGTLTTIYSFCAQSGCPDGFYPYAPLTQVANGDFWGTTSQGGAYGGGTVFRVTPSENLTTVYSFCSQAACRDGTGPSAVIQAANGDLYGTTRGGAYGGGTIFKMTQGGDLTTLHSFCAQSEYYTCTDGSGPTGLVQAADGDFYGTTYYGGLDNCETGCGTIFKITPSGNFTSLYNFCPQPQAFVCPDGDVPNPGLIQATNGDLYGITQNGGAYFGLGAIFKITPSGAMTALYSFCSNPDCPDGAGPAGALVQDTNGKFYGTAYAGGTSGDNGTVFSLSLDLGAFVKTLPRSGHVGEPIKILGNNLTSATSVTFNGIATTFTVNSSSEISTTVPAGATTGKIQVITPGGTLSSNVPFRVP